jgi:hypothetical protein
VTTSRLKTLRTELVTDIQAQLTSDGVSGVTVTPYPVLADQWTREDRVWLGSITGEQEPLTQGPNGKRVETLTVELTVYAPTFGGTEEEQAAGEGRAETIFASVETAVRTDITVNNTVFDVNVESYESNPAYVDADGPVGMFTAELVAEAHI